MCDCQLKKSLDTKGAEYVRKRMPMIGLGTWQVDGEKTVFDVLDAALDAGYRFIDTAQVYANEEEIGKALKTLLPKYNLKREDIFITSKLWCANQGAELCCKSVLESLRKLQTDYLDLMLIHYPGLFEIDTNKNGYHNALDANDPKHGLLRGESWSELEKLYKEGKLRAIGISNYNVPHMEQLLKKAEVLPAVNQCEYNPYWYQPDVVKFCRDHGIHFQTYSSFGSAVNRKQMFEDEKINAMAARYQCSVQEFLLAWALSQGMSVLPRSTNPAHVRANFKIAAKNVQITPEDVEAVKAKNMNKACWDPSEVQS